MKRHQTLDEFEEDYLINHPDTIDIYLSELFEEYAEHQNAAVLLSSLRVIARVKGISQLAETAGITRQGLQKALSAKGNPRLDTLGVILGGMGYRLAVKPM